ncbi:hypothetical protein HK100_002656, partial [Physocladia obscura]
GVATLLTHLLLTAPQTATTVTAQSIVGSDWLGRSISARCFAYSPPGSIATPRANVTHFSRFVTSIVLGDDAVPRLNRRSVERLKQQVSYGVRNCRARKVDVIGGVFGVRRGIDFDQVFGIDECGASGGAGGSIVVDVDVEDDDDDNRDGLGQEDDFSATAAGIHVDEEEEKAEFQIPGRVLHFRKIKIPIIGDAVNGRRASSGEFNNEDEDDSVSTPNVSLVPPSIHGSNVPLAANITSDRNASIDVAFRNSEDPGTKRMYRAVWTVPDYFHDIIISSTMVSEHMPNILGNILRRSLEVTRASDDQDSSACFVADVPFRNE